MCFGNSCGRFLLELCLSTAKSGNVRPTVYAVEQKAAGLLSSQLAVTAPEGEWALYRCYGALSIPAICRCDCGPAGPWAFSNEWDAKKAKVKASSPAVPTFRMSYISDLAAAKKSTGTLICVASHDIVDCSYSSLSHAALTMIRNNHTDHMSSHFQLLGLYCFILFLLTGCSMTQFPGEGPCLCYRASLVDGFEYVCVSCIVLYCIGLNYIVCVCVYYSA